MSKKCKSKSKERRRAAKRARKQGMKAKYEAFSAAGKNTKSKRFASKGKIKTARMNNHPLGKCGNIGCIKCFGIRFSGFLKNGKPYRMPHWMWLRWIKEK